MFNSTKAASKKLSAYIFNYDIENTNPYLIGVTIHKTAIHLRFLNAFANPSTRLFSSKFALFFRSSQVIDKSHKTKVGMVHAPFRFFYFYQLLRFHHLAIVTNLCLIFPASTQKQGQRYSSNCL